MSPTASNSSSLSMTAPARLVGQQQLQVVQYLVFSTPGTLMDPCEPDRSVRRACFRALGDLWDVVLPKTNKSLSVFSFSLCTSTLILQFLQEIFLCKTVLPFFLRLPVCFMYKTCRQASVDQPQFVFFTFMIFIKENTLQNKSRWCFYLNFPTLAACFGAAVMTGGGRGGAAQPFTRLHPRTNNRNQQHSSGSMKRPRRSSEMIEFNIRGRSKNTPAVFLYV